VLSFQERADGYRVVRKTGEVETMVASVQTKLGVNPGSNEYRELLVAKVRADGLSSEQARQLELNGVVLYAPLPRSDWTIHSAIGPLPVSLIEEILGGLTEGPLRAYTDGR
jgi:hypothetical protein